MYLTKVLVMVLRATNRLNVFIRMKIHYTNKRLRMGIFSLL